MFGKLKEAYDYVFIDLADERILQYPLMSSPIYPLLIVASYLLGVYKIFPAFMEKRKPYELKPFLFWYNIFQIFANIGLLQGILTSGWTTHYTLGCQPVDYSDNPLALKMLKYVYFAFLLKITDLTETVVFILRKKKNQVSGLHVYHHASSLLLVWIGGKFVGGGMATFPGLINTPIHVVMYIYYLLSSLGPEWQRRVTKWKQTITMLQMIQFGILILHSAQAALPGCHVQKGLLLLYVPNVAVIWNMFWQFYKASYLKGDKQKI